MAPLNNPLALLVYRTIVGLGSRCDILGAHRVPRRHHGLLLACTHLSHYDPFTVSTLLRRKVDWMARAELFRSPAHRFWVRHADAFRIDRRGPWLPGIREALCRLEQGRLVGIFPEGDVTRETNSVLLGAPVKRGAAFLARRAGVSVVPCVVLGSDQFRRVPPWAPLRSGRLWIGFGEPLAADMTVPSGRASRRELTDRLEAAFRDVYAELLLEFDVHEYACPRERVSTTA